jgi:hypothetical protein
MNSCCKIPTYGTYSLPRKGFNVEALLSKIEALGLATYTKDGLMSSADKQKLDCLQPAIVKYNTTAYWDSRVSYIPGPGDIIIYSDFKTIENGTGNAYVQDLAFINDFDSAEIMEHISNTVIHVTQEEKDFWNNKLNIDDAQEVIGEVLVFNRR